MLSLVPPRALAFGRTVSARPASCAAASTRTRRRPIRACQPTWRVTATDVQETPPATSTRRPWRSTGARGRGRGRGREHGQQGTLLERRREAGSVLACCATRGHRRAEVQARVVGPNECGPDPGLSVSPVVERNVPHGEVFLEEAFANNYGFTAMNAGSSRPAQRPRAYPYARYRYGYPLSYFL